MKRKTKFALVLFLVLLACAVFSGCDFFKKSSKLDVPKNIRLSGESIIWDSVPNASGYDVKLDDQIESVTANRLDAQTLAPKVYMVCVRATKGSSKSDWSEQTQIEIAQKYTLSILCGEGGEVKVEGAAFESGKFRSGTKLSIVLTTSAGYELEGWYKGDERLGGSSIFSYTTESEDVVLDARLVQYFSVIVSASEGGKAQPTPSTQCIAIVTRA